MSWMTVYGRKRAKKKRRIQEILDEAGLNQRRLADRVGVSRQTVSQTLNGSIHSKKVLDGLRGIGVAENLLFDPHNEETQV